MNEINKMAELPIKGTLNDGPEEEALEEVKEAEVEETPEEEKETPTELPADEKPDEADGEPAPVDDTADVRKQMQGLQEERVKLLKEIQELRGQRRELKQDQLRQVDQKIDDLKDVHPQDVQLIEKVLRSKGYITKEEAKGMSYQAVQNEELSQFLNEFPEYKPENDPGDINWSRLQRALAIYAKPSDPRMWKEILHKAHKDIAPSVSDRTIEVKKRQIKTAGVGSSGVQKSSSRTTLTPEQRQSYIEGGWSKEEIEEIERNL